MSEYIITENIEDWRFRNKPNWVIKKIIVTEFQPDECVYPVIVSVLCTTGKIEHFSYTLNGLFNIEDGINDRDIVPRPKIFPFIHQDIMEIRSKWAIFKHKDCHGTRINQSFTTITAYNQELQEYTLEGGFQISCKEFKENYLYSLDNGYTWLPQYKEVTE